jgi:hypothetical protein
MNDEWTLEDAAHAAAEHKLSRCVSCMVYVFYFAADAPLVSGHIATPAGLEEFRRSHICEKCFNDARLTEEQADNFTRHEGRILHTGDTVPYRGRPDNWAELHPHTIEPKTTRIDREKLGDQIRLYTETFWEH